MRSSQGNADLVTAPVIKSVSACLGFDTKIIRLPNNSVMPGSQLLQDPPDTRYTHNDLPILVPQKRQQCGDYSYSRHWAQKKLYRLVRFYPRNHIFHKDGRYDNAAYNAEFYPAEKHHNQKSRQRK